MSYCKNCGLSYFDEVIPEYPVCPDCLEHQRKKAQALIKRHSDMKGYTLADEEDERKRRARTKVGYNRL